MTCPPSTKSPKSTPSLSIPSSHQRFPSLAIPTILLGFQPPQGRARARAHYHVRDQVRECDSPRLPHQADHKEIKKITSSLEPRNSEPCYRIYVDVANQTWTCRRKKEQEKGWGWEEERRNDPFAFPSIFPEGISQRLRLLDASNLTARPPDVHCFFIPPVVPEP